MSDIPRMNIVQAIEYGMTGRLPEQRERNMARNGLGFAIHSYTTAIIIKATPEQEAMRAKANSHAAFWRRRSTDK